jgi:hypothetical protein
MERSIKTEREIFNRSFDEVTESLNTTVINDVKIDDSTPINVVVTSDVVIDPTTPLNTRLVDKDGVYIDSNNPIDVDGDQVFNKDIDFSRSNIPGFTGLVSELFDDLYSTITNYNATSPKVINIYLNRAYLFNGISIATATGNFSNVKIYGVVNGNEILLNDDSFNNLKYTSSFYRFSITTGEIPIGVFGLVGFKIEFHTIDGISVGSLNANKWSTGISIIQGQTPKGNYVDFQATNRGSFKVALTEYQGDAFGRLKTSLPFTVFDNTMVYDTKDLFWSNLIVGGSSIQTRSLAKATLTVNAGSGNYVVEQTKMRFKYQPGKALEILMTGLLKTELGVTKRIGYFDVDSGVLIDSTPKNGVYFENNSGLISWNIVRNGVVVDAAYQSDWNEDRLNSNGATGFNIDFNSTQIWFIDLEWLGVGTVRCGFVIDGEMVVCHKFHHANRGMIDVYMSSANLPLNYSILSNGGSGTMEHICSTVVSGGGFNPIGVSRSVTRNTKATINNGLIRGILGIRLKADSWNNTVLPITLALLSGNKSDCKVSLCLNPIYAATPVWTNLTNSTIQYTETVITPTNNGIVSYEALIDSGVANFNQELETTLRLGKSLNGVMDELWILVTSLTANDTYYVGLTFAELL